MRIQDIYLGALQIIGKEEGIGPSSFVDRVPYLLNNFAPYLNPFRTTELPEIKTIADELDLSAKEANILRLYLARQIAYEEGFSEGRIEMIVGDFNRAMSTLSTGMQQIPATISD